MSTMTQIAIPGFSPSKQGKVRDIYDLGEKLILVATDRISVFDVVLPTPIPEKGRVLTQISAFWFEKTNNIIENHLISIRVNDFPKEFQAHQQTVTGRSMLVKKTRPLAVECIVRGYLSGSGWNEYQKSGAVCGIKLPQGLRESDRLPEPIFTPSTKAQKGHDQNISFDDMKKILKDVKLAQRVQEISIAIYKQGCDIAQKNGIIIADTKFEFGLLDNKLLLIDEVLTPDSSRFWPASDYRPGKPQKSFDKQFVRDYCASLGWNKTYPGPDLPANIVAKTQEKYLEAYRLLTGKSLER